MIMCNCERSKDTKESNHWGITDSWMKPNLSPKKFIQINLPSPCSIQHWFPSHWGSRSQPCSSQPPTDVQDSYRCPGGWHSGSQGCQAHRRQEQWPGLGPQRPVTGLPAPEGAGLQLTSFFPTRPILLTKRLQISDWDGGCCGVYLNSFIVALYDFVAWPKGILIGVQ